MTPEKLTTTSLVEMMRKAGIRPSAQRLAVMSYIGNHRTHPTVDEIYSSILDDFPSLSRTTVYNSVHLLVESGLLRELQIEPGNARYDLAPQPQHSHFICRRCGRISDMPYPTGMSVTTADGFEIDSVDVYLHGLCPECRKETISHN